MHTITHAHMHTWNRHNCLCRYLKSGIQTVFRGTLVFRKNFSFIIKQVSIILTVLIEFLFPSLCII